MSMETMNKPSTTMSEKIIESIGDIVTSSLEATAQISLGQGLLKIVDRFLWVIEKSAQWSLPIHEVNSEENGKAFGKIELIRPLPWIFFLPSLVILRACRFGINIIAFILGLPKLQTTGMVKFIQKGRRRLRAIKSHGLKKMRYRKGSRNKEDELNEAKKSLIKSMLSTLSALSCLETSKRTPSPPPTRLCVERFSEPDTTSTPEEKSTTESTSPQVDCKRKYCEIIELDDSNSSRSSSSTVESETTEDEKTQIILGASMQSESDDQDFDPAEDELMESDSTSVDEEEEEDDDYLSDTEIYDLHADQKLQPFSNDTVILDSPIRADVILEEPEPEPEPEPESGIESDVASAMSKISTPINRIPFIDTMQSPKEKPACSITDQLTPVILITDGENIANFFSPIDSPNSISDFTSPAVNDNSIDDCISVEKLLQSESTRYLKNIQINEPETNVDDAEDTDTIDSSIISGMSSDGQATATATTNGRTTNDDQKRSNHTTGIIPDHRKGKDNKDLPSIKEK